MMMKKKITRKKLKEPDEFVHFSEKVFLFITQHSKKIVAGGVILVVIVLAVIFFQRWEKKKEESASRILAGAVEAYQTVSSPGRERPPGEYKVILDKFDEIIANFPRTSSGTLSLLYKGNIHLRLGEFDEAAKAYESFLQRAGKEGLYQIFATEGLGYAYEGKKEYEKAVQAYQKIIDMGDTFRTTDTYLNMGRCYEKLGKKKEALESYKNFLKASPKSQMTNVVLRKISQLEG